MSGILVDVDVGGNSGKEIATINKNLRSIGKTANDVSSSLNNAVKLNGFTAIGKSISGLIPNFAKLGRSASDSLSGISRNADEGSKALSSMDNTVSKLTKVFATLASTVVAATSVDSFTNMQNKLKLVTDTVEDLTSLQRDLVSTARDTRSSLTATTNLYTKFSMSLKDTGVSSKEFLVATKTIQQAAQISGSSMESANAAIMQLGQALSSGVLRGEELNSILEQLPRAAKLIADNLGVGIGELRKLGEEGKLSADSVFQAIIDGSQQIDKEFGKTSATISQSIAIISDSFIVLLGNIDKLTGASRVFSQAADYIARSLVNFSEYIVSTAATTKIGINEYVKSLTQLSYWQNIINGFKKGTLSFLDLDLLSAEIDGVKELVSWVEKLKSVTKISELFDKMLNIIGKFTPSLLEVIKVVNSMFYAFIKSFDTFQYMIPKLAGPVLSLADNIKLAFNSVAVRTGSSLAQILTQVELFTRGVAEQITFFILFDRRTERAMAALANSKSWDDLARRFYALGEAASTRNFSNFFINIGDKVMYVRMATQAIHRLGASLGLVNSKLIYINNVRFDRLLRSIETIGVAFSYLYRGFILPKVSVILVEIYNKIMSIAIPVGNLLQDVFDRIDGTAIARSLISTFSRIVDSLSASLAKLVESINWSKISGSITNVVEGIIKKLGDFLKTIGAALLDIDLSKPMRYLKSKIMDALESIDFKGIYNILLLKFKEIIELLGKGLDKMIDAITSDKLVSAMRRGFEKLKTSINPAGIFEDMVKKINISAKELLKSTVKIIARFVQIVIDLFKYAWDAVVGHSWWPDLIDGVINYAKHIGKAFPPIENFIIKVSDSFKGLLNKIINAKDPFTVIGNFFQNLYKAMIESFPKFGQTLGVLLIESIVFAFLSAEKRMLFLLQNMLAVMYKLFKSNPDVFGAMMSGVGASVGQYVAEIGKIAKQAMNAIIVMIPDFARGFLGSSFGIIGNLLSKFIGAMPPVVAAAIVAALISFRAGLKETTAGFLKDVFLPPFKAGLAALGSMIMSTAGGGKVGGMMGLWLFGKHPATLALSALAVIKALFADISAASLAYVGIPLLYILLLGDKTTGPIVARLTKDILGILYTGIFSPAIKAVTGFGAVLGSVLSHMFMSAVASTRGKMGGTSLADAFMGPPKPSFIRNAARDLLSAIGTVLKNVKSGLSAYGAGTINLSELLFGLSDTKTSAAKFVSALNKPFSLIKETVTTAMSKAFDPKVILRMKKAWSDLMSYMYESMIAVVAAVSKGLGRLTGYFLALAANTKLVIGAVLLLGTLFSSGAFAADIGGIGKSAMGAMDAIFELILSITGLYVALKTLDFFFKTKKFMNEGNTLFKSMGMASKEVAKEVIDLGKSIGGFLKETTSKFATFAAGFYKAGGIIRGTIGLIIGSIRALVATVALLATNIYVIVAIVAVITTALVGSLVWGHKFTDAISDAITATLKFFGIMETTPAEEMQKGFTKLVERVPKQIGQMTIDINSAMKGINLVSASDLQLETLSGTLKEVGDVAKLAKLEFTIFGKVTEETMTKLNSATYKFYESAAKMPKGLKTGNLLQELEAVNKALEAGPDPKKTAGSIADNIQGAIKTLTSGDPIKIPMLPEIDFMGIKKFKAESEAYLSRIRISTADLGSMQELMTPSEKDNLAKQFNKITGLANIRKAGEGNVTKEMNKQADILDNMLSDYRKITAEREEEFGIFREEVDFYQKAAKFGSRAVKLFDNNALLGDASKAASKKLDEWAVDATKVLTAHDRKILEGYDEFNTRLIARINASNTSSLNVIDRQAMASMKEVAKGYEEIAKKSYEFKSGLEQAIASGKTGFETSDIQDLIRKAPTLAKDIVIAGRDWAKAMNEFEHMPLRGRDESLAEFESRVQKMVDNIKSAGDRVKAASDAALDKIGSPREMLNKDLAKFNIPEIAIPTYFKLDQKQIDGFKDRLKVINDFTDRIANAHPSQKNNLETVQHIEIQKLTSDLAQYGKTIQDVSSQSGVALEKLLSRPALAAKFASLQAREAAIITKIETNPKASQEFLNTLGKELASVRRQAQDMADSVNVDWRTPLSRIEQQFSDEFTKVGLSVPSFEDMFGIDKAGLNQIEVLKNKAKALMAAFDWKTGSLVELKRKLAELGDEVKYIGITADKSAKTVGEFMDRLGINADSIDGIEAHTEALTELDAKITQLNNLKAAKFKDFNQIAEIRALEKTVNGIQEKLKAQDRSYGTGMSNLNLDDEITKALPLGALEDMMAYKAGEMFLRDLRNNQDISTPEGKAEIERLTKMIENYKNDSVKALNKGLEGDPFLQTRTALDRIGVNMDDVLYRFNDTTLASVNAAVTEIEDIRAQLESGKGKLSPDQIRTLRESMRQQFLLLEDFRYNIELLAEQAGQGMSDSMKSSFEQQMEDLLMFKTTGIKAIRALAEDFTSSIVKSFVEGMTAGMFGPGSESDKMFKDLGKKFFEYGSKILGALGGLFGGGGDGLVQLGGPGSGIDGMATGGPVIGPGTGTSDSIPAWLSNNEYVIKASRAQMFKPLLDQINYGRGPLRFAGGGSVNVGYGNNAVKSSVDKRDKDMGFTSNKMLAQTFNIAVTGDVSRQTRNEISKMPREIASMVNKQNVEWNKRQ